jgi:hypothetical protein
VSVRDVIGTWWPVVLPLLAVAGSTVRAEAQNVYQNEQIVEIRRFGVPAANERLARMEATQENMKHQLDRIERKLDTQVK